jgi:hypothetical protein
MGEESGDGALEPADAVEASATNRLVGDHGEPALDEVQPRGTGRGEVHLEAGMLHEPLLHLGMLVRAVVVADQMDLATGIVLGDRVEEGEKLLVGMPRVAASVHPATGDVERGEQAAGSSPRFLVKTTRTNYREGGDGIPWRRQRRTLLGEFARRLYVLPTGERAKGWLGSSPQLREPRFPPPTDWEG